MLTWDSFVIIFGCLIINYLTFGMVTSFGLMYSELIEYFDTGKGETTWIPSLAFGMMLATGTVASLIERRYGAAKLTVLGGIIMAAGMVSSMFVPNMHLLYLTYGIISGTGFGFSMFAAQIIVTLHSDKRRAIEVAIATTGTGIGRMTLPFLTRYCLTEYGWRGTFLILAGFGLQAVVVGFLFQLIAKSKSANTQKPEEKKKISLSFVRTGKFCLFASSVLLYCLAYLVPYVVLPSFASEKGISRKKGDMLIMVSGVTGILGRIIIGLIANLKKISNIYLYGGILLLDGLLSTGCAFVDVYPLFVIYATFLGIFTGSYAVLMPIATVDVVGKENLSIALGLVSLFAGIAMSVGPPIAGWISDATGRYDEAFFYRGGIYILGGILCGFVPFTVSKKKQYATVPTTDGTTELCDTDGTTELCDTDGTTELCDTDGNTELCDTTLTTGIQTDGDNNESNTV